MQMITTGGSGSGKTEIAAYRNVQDPVAFMQQVGTEIAQSRMLGCANEAQGRVLAMTCLCEGISPIEFGRKYHIVQNNLSMRADAMLAELRARGGKHKVVERTADAAEVEISYDGQVYRERFTWEEAKDERFVYCKDGKTIKDNWATPRGRRQMLWARVISEAVRTLAPEIVSGAYTPEEVRDLDHAVTENGKAVDVDQLMQQTLERANGHATKGGEQGAGEVIEAEYEITPDKEGGDGNGEADSPAVAMATADQRNRIRELWGVLNLTEEQRDMTLAKRQVKSVKYLTSIQAAEFIATMERRAEEIAATLSGDSRVPDNATATHATGAVGQALVDEIKQHLRGDVDGVKLVQRYLQALKKQKIADLSEEQAVGLKQALQVNQLEQWVALQIN